MCIDNNFLIFLTSMMICITWTYVLYKEDGDS